MTEKVVWDLTDPQWEIFTSDKKFRIFLGGVGSGKTAIGWMNAVKFSIDYPGSMGVIISPTYTNLRDVILKEMDAWVPEWKIEEFNKTDKQLTLKNGSIILFRAADNERSIERLRGMSIAWFWIDEVTLLHKNIWNVMVGRIRQKGFPHKAWLTGTPKMNWVFDEFIDEKTRITTDDEYKIVSEVSTDTNIHLPADYINTLKKTYSGKFYDQEILGKFVAFEGLIYTLTEANWVPNSEIKQMKFDRIVYGIDFGFQNPTSIVVFGRLGDRVYVIGEYYARKMSEGDIVTVMESFYDYYGSGFCYCDPSEPRTIDKLKESGIRAVKADNDVLSGIRAVEQGFGSGKLIINDVCQNIRNECKTYVWADTAKEQPVKVNDHAMDALRYGYVGLTSKKKGKGAMAFR